MKKSSIISALFLFLVALTLSGCIFPYSGDEGGGGRGGGYHDNGRHEGGRHEGGERH